MSRRHEQTFLQRRHSDGQQTHEKVLHITRHQEIQIKTTLRYHLTPVRMAKINKSGDDRCWRGCREGESSYTMVGMLAGATTLENSMEVPQKVENRAILWLQLHYWVFTQRYKCSDPKGHLHLNVYSSNVHSSPNYGKNLDVHQQVSG